MKIIIGADHGGFRLKEQITLWLKKKGHSVKDVGVYSESSCDYPLIAYDVARNVSVAKFPRGIIICKTGIGNSIVANKLPRVRAALCTNLEMAEFSRRHNDSNILVLGANFIDIRLAKKMLGVWLKTKFEAGRHLRRIKQIKDIERSICRGLKPLILKSSK